MPRWRARHCTDSRRSLPSLVGMSRWIGVIAALLVAIGMASGCATVISGKPIASPAFPTEPRFPMPRPSRLPTPTAPLNPPPIPPSSGLPAPSPPTTTAAPGNGQLAPNAQGYVYVATKSGKTRCEISRDAVGCESEFTNSPIMDGEHANGVHVSADGTVRWILGNLGDIPAVTLDYRTYEAQGWTIDASSGGTKFSNDHTGHGIFVSVDRVESF